MVWKLTLEMLDDLRAMGTDTYLQCKLMLTVDADTPALKNYVKQLFKVADSQRPLQIEMKRDSLQ